MAETLQSVKSRLSRQHLGRHGIHAIGVRESEGAVCLYVKSRARLEATGVLKEIEIEAAPFKILVTEEPQASLADEPRESGGRPGTG